MSSWSGVGVCKHPIGTTYLTNSRKMPMSQVGPLLSLEVRGSEDTKHHCLPSLPDCSSLKGPLAHQSSNLGDSWAAMSL